MVTPVATTCAPRLRRELRLWDLVLYGVIVIQPVAPMSVFGVLSQRAHGHVVTTVLLALVAMLFTAISYGRMAGVYPSAGSAFTYVSHEISPAAGYVTGWSMVMDYLLNPMICIIWISQQAHVFAPAIPYWAWTAIVASLFTMLNVQGVRTSARINAALAGAMAIVVVVFLAAAAHYIAAQPQGPGFLARPFYDPASWNTRQVLGGTSLAVLTYIGFDAISTLSEEARDPRRNIFLASVLCCLLIGLLSAVEVYAAQLAWPASEPFPDADTAFTFVAGRTWQPLFAVVGATLVVANFGSGMGAQLGAARLLYGMGRSGALPASFFAAIDSDHHVPRNNVLLVGALAFGGALLLPAIAGQASGFELGANLLNFGALIAFMGVNAAAFLRFFVHAPRRTALNLAAPLLGFSVCLLLWWNLDFRARVLGMVWMVAGLALAAYRMRGTRRALWSASRAAAVPREGSA